MRGKPISFSDFSGGVNRRDQPYQLQSNEARDARNVHATVRGAARKRDGAQTFATPANALTSLFAAQAPTFLIGAGSTKLFSISPAGAVTDITGALGLTSNLLFEWVQAPASGGQGPLYGQNGAQAVQWTGSGNAAAWTAATGTLPIGKYLVAAGNRVWVAGMTSYGSVSDPGSTVVFSELGDPRNWPAANVVQFDPNDGEPITGIGRVGPYVLVFKPSKTWVVYDTDIGANRPLVEGVGCVAHRSIVETQDGLFFLSRDQGAFKTDGSAVDRLDDRLQPELDAILQANRQLAAAVFFDGHYYLSISQSGLGNTVLLDYDVIAKSWWLHTLPAAQLTVWEPAGDPQLFGAVPGVARVDRLFVPGRVTDALGAFAGYWLGSHHTLGVGALRKRVRALHFDGKGKIEVAIARDFAGAAAPEGVADFAAAAGATTLFGVDDGSLFGVDDGSLFGAYAEIAGLVLPSLGVARAWSVQFGNVTADSYEVESYTFFTGDRKD